MPLTASEAADLAGAILLKVPQRERSEAASRIAIAIMKLAGKSASKSGTYSLLDPDVSDTLVPPPKK